MSERSKVLSVLLHSTAVVIYAVSTNLLLTARLPAQLRPDLYGMWKFLTFWNLIVHLTVFSMSLVVDVIGRRDSSGQRRAITRALDLLFNSIVLPMAAFIAISYWSIIAIKKELMAPEGVQNLFPRWLDHSVHTLILPIALIDNYLVDHRRREEKYGLTFGLTFSSAYTLLVLYLGLVEDFWVYPVLAFMDMSTRLVYMTFNFAIGIIFYGIGGLLYDLAWKSDKVSPDILVKKLV